MMRGRGSNATLLTAIIRRHLHRPFLGIFGLVFGVSSFLLLSMLLLGSGTSTTQAAPPLPHLALHRLVQGDCNEPGNLVPNPSFECEGSSPIEPANWFHDTWEGSPAIFFRSSLFHHSGNYSVFLGSGSRGSRSRWRSMWIRAHPGRIYEFSAWVKADQLSRKATVTLTFWSEDPLTILKVVDAEGTGDTDDWVRLIDSYAAPPETDLIRLECRLYGEGMAWYDDAKVGEYITEPVLDLAQLDAPDPVSPGESSLVYTLVYSNTGNSAATNVVITNTFDAHVTFTDSVPEPDGGSGQVRFWEFSSVQVDGPHQIVVTTTVESPLPDRTMLFNFVEWRSDQTAREWNIEETEVRSVPIPTITKTDERDPVKAGDRLTYTIAYTNGGTAPMTGIYLTEFYPLHTTFITAKPPPSNPPLNTHWLMPDLSVGKSQSVTIVLGTSELAAGEVCNTVLFNSDGIDPISVQELTTITPDTPPTYSIQLSPDPSLIRARVGERVTRTYQLANMGSQRLTHVQVTSDTLENWRGGIAIEPTYFESIPQGDCQTVTLTVEPATDEISGTHTIQLTATSAETLTRATATIEVPRHWGVEIEPDSLGGALPGDQVTFTHWITNLGNFTDTISISRDFFTIPSCSSWYVNVQPNTCANVGIGETCQVAVTISVPGNAQEDDVCIATIEATVSNGSSDRALDVVRVSPRMQEVFLPVVMKCLSGPDPFCNGSFEEPLEPCWDRWPSDVKRICTSGNCFARLGKPDDCNKQNCEGGISPRHTELVQTFTPTATGVLTLSFDYEVHTQDVLWVDVYDTLEVYLDAVRVWSLTHANPDFGCEEENVPLVLSDAVEIPIDVVDGEQVTLKFSLVNHDTWYNTYADIDNVGVTYAPVVRLQRPSWRRPPVQLP